MKLTTCNVDFRTQLITAIMLSTADILLYASKRYTAVYLYCRKEGKIFTAPALTKWFTADNPSLDLFQLWSII